MGEVGPGLPNRSPILEPFTFNRTEEGHVSLLYASHFDKMPERIILGGKAVSWFQLWSFDCIVWTCEDSVHHSKSQCLVGGALGTSQCREWEKEREGVREEGRGENSRRGK